MAGQTRGKIGNIMSTTTQFAMVASLAGDPGRAAMLHALLDGRALTASELASVAGIAPQTASGHLAQMTEVGLITATKQGRHRYHRLASPAVAEMLESIMRVAADTAPARTKLVVGPRNAALRAARTCYDHIAGKLGVALSEALVGRGFVELEADAGAVTKRGLAFFVRHGIGVEAQGAKRTRVLCRPCLDWSERRPHLAGRLGAALCAHCFAQGWVKRIKDTRALAVTPKGRAALRDVFHLEW